MLKKSKFSFLTVTMLFFAMLFASPAATFAQQTKSKPNPEEQRDAQLKQMTEFKHAFLKKELNLTRAQETNFFRVYDQMDAELRKIGEESRLLERKTQRNAKATDTELESAARALFEQKEKEAEVELKYFEEFRKVLTKRQLFNLKDVERRMTRALLGVGKPRKRNIVD